MALIYTGTKLKTSDPLAAAQKKTGAAKKRVMVSRSLSRWLKLAVPRPNVLSTYLSHSDINQYMDYLERRYASYVSVYTIGCSHERRPIKGILIDCSRMRQGVTQRPAQQQPVENAAGRRNLVMIEAGTHGREWITISTAMCCIYFLTERYARVSDTLKDLRFFIVPLTNPDGYEYTRSKNRQWRKNRRPTGSGYIGTDCNRNYDIHWSLGNSHTGRNTYKGDKPFSEPETRALRNIMVQFQSQLLLFLSFHSYAESIMYPWGISHELPQSWSILNQVAASGRDAIKEHSGRNYRIGSIANVSKRIITGSIVDYAYGVIKVPVALVMELPSVQYGFQPPTSLISVIALETWVGLCEMCSTSYELLPQCNDTVAGASTATMKGSDPPPFNMPILESSDLVKEFEAGVAESEQRISISLLEEQNRNFSDNVEIKFAQRGEDGADVTKAVEHKHLPKAKGDIRVNAWLDGIADGQKHQRVSASAARPRLNPTKPERKQMRKTEKRARREKTKYLDDGILTIGKDFTTFTHPLNAAGRVKPGKKKSINEITYFYKTPPRNHHHHHNHTHNHKKYYKAIQQTASTTTSYDELMKRTQKKRIAPIGSEEYTLNWEKAPTPAPRRFDPARMAELAKPKVPPNTIHFTKETIKRQKIDEYLATSTTVKATASINKIKDEKPKTWPKRYIQPTNISVVSYVEEEQTAPSSTRPKYANGLQQSDDKGIPKSVFDLNTKSTWNYSTGQLKRF